MSEQLAKTQALLGEVLTAIDRKLSCTVSDFLGEGLYERAAEAAGGKWAEMLVACHAERAREEARVGLTVRADELRPGELAYHADDRAGLPWLARVGDTWWWLSGEDDVDLAEVHAAAALLLDGEVCDFRVLVRREGLKTWAEVRDALREEVTRGRQ